MTGDLHCHSIYSDGSATPEQIGKYALRKGLDYIALTDHDTMNGVARLEAYARATSLRVIPGVECTTKDPFSGRPVHVLCYAPKRPLVLKPVLDETSQRRQNAKLAMAEKIQQLYPAVTVEDVLLLSHESASIFESHIMMALANAGLTNQPFGPLLGELIGKQGSCYVPIHYPDTLDVIDMMHQAEGIVVIAQPGQFDSIDLIRRLAREKRIHGIECMHYKNSPEVTKTCRDIAASYHLLVTGGSDFHGMYSKSVHPVGFHTTDEENSRQFLERLQ